MSQDWKEVVFRKKTSRGQGRSASAVNQARQQGGQVETYRKFNAGRNRPAAPSNARKLEEETEVFQHPRVSRETALAIQQARQAKGWTQKDLATRISERVQVVNEYESARAIPNNQILMKLERALGVSLRK